LDSTLAPLLTDKDKLKQILINLLKNASEAMPDGGEITLSTQELLVSDEGKYLEIRVQDNGPGLPEQIRRDLFRPVKSTKAAGHSGLGLSITAQLTKELKGRIHCRSNFRGTEFIIALPGYK
jgi:signal transduction histidine kinase